jgi:tetratricopeptide (TPR) repeat protein
LSPSAKLQTLNNEELTKTARRRHIEPPRLLSQLRGDLDWIVLKCLEKDRTRRYVTANGLAMDIERYLKEETVLARPPSRLYRLQKLVRRNRMVFLFGATAVAALLLGTIFSTLMFVKEREARISETALKRDAEAREKPSHIALLVTQRRLEEADRLLADLPLGRPSIEVAAELRALGDWHAVNGRWREAAARFESSMKVNQLDTPDLISEDHLKFAATSLKAGNRQTYDQFRQAEVGKLGLTNVALEYRSFKFSLLLPADANTLQLFVLGAQVVENSFPTEKETRPTPPHVAQWSEALALLEYRQGQLTQAVDWCYRCESYPAYSAARRSTTSLLKAMSNWRLGHYQTAVVDWTLAYALIQAKSQQGLDIGSPHSTIIPGTREDLEGSWYDWVIADLLMGECDELIAQSDQFSDSKFKSNAADKATAVSLARALGEWHAIRGEWEKARNRFEYVQQSQQPDESRSSVDYYQEALALLKLGDKTGFVRLRDAALSRFKGTTNTMTAQSVMKTALLLPAGDTPMANLEPFVQVLGRAEAGAGQIKEQASDAFWDLMLLGLFEYRRGNYAKAVDLCRGSLGECAFLPMPNALNRVILAMSSHQLADDATARLELDRARSLAQSGLNWGFDQWNWREWVLVRLLLLEADSLIPQSPPPEPSAASR